jgi:hypothetical protein
MRRARVAHRWMNAAGHSAAGRIGLFNMGDDHPWGSYEKDRVPSGYTYPIGRDVVEKALVAAGAQVGSLSFSRPVLDPPIDPQIVICIYWMGARQVEYFTARGTDTSPMLMMWVNAVRSEDRKAIRAQLETGALARACEWAAGFRSARQNTAMFAEQYWYVGWSATGLVESSTWPPAAGSTAPAAER